VGGADEVTVHRVADVQRQFQVHPGAGHELAQRAARPGLGRDLNPETSGIAVDLSRRQAGAVDVDRAAGRQPPGRLRRLDDET
jgi:hypothetical protein